MTAPPPRDEPGSEPPLSTPDPGEPGSEPGFVPPDPDEPPPLDLSSAVGDIPPWGTGLLLLSWAVVFAAIAFRREIGDAQALFAWGASAPGLAARETAWRLLASTFVHAGMAHAFFNAATMLVLGPAVERIFTRPGFWALYAAGGALASLASLAWRAARHPAGLSISVGASGAIFALGGALLVSAWRLRRRLAPSRARAMGGALLFLVGQGLAAGFTRNATDNAAHAGGVVAGALLGALFPLSPRLGGPATGWPLRALGALAALALALALLLAVRGGLAGR
jgi:membrane associated rhomboid family serine protease